MRFLLTAVVFALGVVVVYFAVTKFPIVRSFRDCYNTAYSILNEEGSITRRAWVTDETICGEHKEKLLLATQCFAEVESKNSMNLTEKSIFLQAAQQIAKGTMTMDELITDHNKRCSYRKTIMEYDPRTDSWY